jgi:hypothetical protein
VRPWRSLLLSFSAAALLLLAACPEPEPGDAPRCGISGLPGLLDGSLLNPYPSAQLLAADSATETGCRVAIPDGSVPVGDSRPLDLARLDRRDGFSPVNTALLRAGVAFDAGSLPPVSDPLASLSASASVQLWDLDHHERIISFAELDAWEPQADADRTLLVRPLQSLGFGTRVAVVLTDSLLTADGASWAGPPDFARVRDEGARAAEAAGMDPAVAAHYASLLLHIEAAGGPERARIRFAWDFVTASEANVLAPLRTVVDRVLEASPVDEPGGPSWEPEWSASSELEAPADALPAGVWREIRGSFQSPQFIHAEDPADDGDAGKDDSGFFRLDAEGLPQERGPGPVYFVGIVPESLRQADPGSAPLLVFGHGIFAKPADYLASWDDASGLVDLCNRLQAVCIGTEWRGLTERDLADALRVATDLGRFPLITDKLAQGVANTVALSRLMRSEFTEAGWLRAADGSASLLDPERRYYYGISLGGIEGSVFLASQDGIRHGVLHVPGSTWSTMLERSSNWEPLEDRVAQTLSDPGDRQLLYAISQMLWDPVDPVNHVSALRERSALWQVALADEQVPTFTAEALARSISVPLVEPAVQPVPGLSGQTAPLGPGASALFEAESGFPYPPPGNRPAPVTGAHLSLRNREEHKQQVLAFFEAGAEGTIIQPCGEPCVFSPEDPESGARR